MELMDLSCPKCGAAMDYDEKKRLAKCPHCGMSLLVSDDRLQVDGDSFEEAGYRFERGRRRARREADDEAFDDPDDFGDFDDSGGDDEDGEDDVFEIPADAEQRWAEYRRSQEESAREIREMLRRQREEQQATERVNWLLLGTTFLLAVTCPIQPKWLSYVLMTLCGALSIANRQVRAQTRKLVLGMAGAVFVLRWLFF